MHMTKTIFISGCGSGEKSPLSSKPISFTITTKVGAGGTISSTVDLSAAKVSGRI